MNKKVKLFYGVIGFNYKGIEKLEEEINKFLSVNEISLVDIKYQISEGRISAMVIYEE